MPKLSRVGACIYCGGSTDLTSEHIIPLGMGGTIELPDASCRGCAKITSAFERRLLRGHWWPHRRRLRLQTRRPREQPATFPAVVQRGTDQSTREFPPDNYAGLVVFDFDPPSHLRGIVAKGKPIAPRVFFRRDSNAAVEVVNRETPIIGVSDPSVTFRVDLEVDDFVRLLAKVALGWAIGSRGLDAFERLFVRDIIIRDTEGAATFVGGAGSALLGPWLPGAGLHRMLDRLQGPDVSVYVQLFCEAKDPPPIYEVIVGRLKSERRPPA
jgi:hypothetical protein